MAEGDLTSEVSGEVGLAGKTLVIKKIRVAYALKVDREHASTVERVHEMHAEYCPVAKTISGCVAIETSVDLIGN